MTDKQEFLAKLDGTLEDQLKAAFYEGFGRGHKFGQQFTKVKVPVLKDWMIAVDYREWYHGK